MAVSAQFREMVAELLAPLGPVTIRSMFGGAGIFRDGVMFALIADETLYLKAEARDRAIFEAAGKGPFTYQARNGRRSVMAYYELPDELLDDPDEFRIWARRALDAALQARSSKPPRRRKSGG